MTNGSDSSVLFIFWWTVQTQIWNVEEFKQRKIQNSFAIADRIKIRSGLDFEFTFEFRDGLETILHEIDEDKGRLALA